MAKQKITEDQLKAITDQEIRQSLGYMGGKLSEARRKAEYYYLGLPKGDLAPTEIEGRSSVVSTDVADTIEWMLPSLLKIFTAGENVVEFSPQQEQEEKSAKQATDYVNYVFYRQNPGFQLLYTWFKDALLQKTGILKIWWDDKKDEEKEEYEGLTDIELTMLLQDSDVAAVAHTARVATSPEGVQHDVPGQMQVMPPPTILHDVTVKRTKNNSQVRVENVPPEEFLIDRRAKKISEATFVAHRVARTVSDLKAMGYKNVDALTSDDSVDINPERIERMAWDDETPYLTGNEDSIDKSQRILWLTECYMRVDFDGDGIAEWRKIVRCGNQLLENEECDGPPFASITPIPLPHRFHGLSIADMAIPIQTQKTAVLRAILDNLYLQVNGRYYAVDNQVNLDDLLTSRPGGVVRVKEAGATGRLDQGMADAGSAYQMLEYMETQKENRTGFTRYNQGQDLSPNTLNQTATGMNILTNRADVRMELIARVFAETGVKDLFNMILKLVSQHQDQAAMMKVSGKWIQIDPREWKNQFDMTINVGLGTGNKDQIVQHLMQVLGIQKEALQIGLSTPENLYNSASKLAENLGFKQPGLFFTDPKEAQPQQQKPDPEMLKIQMEQQKNQGDLQLKAQESQASIQLDRERNQFEAQREAAKLQGEMQLEQMRLSHDENVRLQVARIEAEAKILVAQIAAGVQAQNAEATALQGFSRDMG